MELPYIPIEGGKVVDLAKLIMSFIVKTEGNKVFEIPRNFLMQNAWKEVFYTLTTNPETGNWVIILEDSNPTIQEADYEIVEEPKKLKP